jgi:hypothetical protein
MSVQTGYGQASPRSARHRQRTLPVATSVRIRAESRQRFDAVAIRALPQPEADLRRCYRDGPSQIRFAEPRMGAGRSRWRVHAPAHEETKKWAVVPISAFCRGALEECRTRCVVSRYVFINHDGSRVPDIALRRSFLRAKRIAGIIRRFRFHDLRHTAACTLASGGVSLQVIRKILGHTSTKMTKRYVRVNDAAVAEARRARHQESANWSQDSRPPGLKCI